MLNSKRAAARRARLKNKKRDIPSNVATKEIPPYPRYPPESWVGYCILLCVLFVALIFWIWFVI